MSVAMICSRSSSTAVVSFPPEKKEVLGSINLLVKNVDECPPPPPPGELIDIWSSIQAHKKQAKQPNVVDEEPYVHPLTRRSSSGLMSQKSLEICTESLGSETGSSEDDDMDHSIFSTTRCPIKQQAVKEEEEDDVVDVDHDEVAGVKKQRKEQQGAAVNYHCSISSSSRRTSPGRAFPPPLPSISCRDGPCVQMRPHRKDGRLVVEAVAVPSQNYLHAQRQGGRLLLSFINTTPPKRSIINTATNLTPEQTQEEVLAEEQDAESMELEDQEEEEEEEEEVEVVDRGTVVEVKVSTQPQQQSGGGRGSAAMKVHRSSIVINKFVSCTYSLSSQDKELNIINNSDDDHAISTASGPRRSTAASTTTAAAAAVAASSLGTLPADGNHPSGFDNKLLFTTSKRSNREELLRDMRRCSQLRKPLFIWEPCCIATSS